MLRLNRVPIALRIYAGFGSLIILGLLIAAVGEWQLGTVAGDIGRLTTMVDGQGSQATLVVAGKAATAVTVRDISRGGVSLLHAGTVPVGIEVRLELAGAGAAVPARVARSDPGLLALAFRQDPASLARVDLALDALTARMPRAAA